MKDVAAVLADLGLQWGSLAAARALLVAARHPQETPDNDEEHDDDQDDDRDRQRCLAVVGSTSAMQPTITALIGRVGATVIPQLGGWPHEAGLESRLHLR